MSLFRYTKALQVPKRGPLLTTGEAMERLIKILTNKTRKKLNTSANTLFFKNLYLKKLDLVPVPKGWIQIQDLGREFKISFSADYSWRNNPAGRWLTLGLVFAMTWVALFKTFAGSHGGQLFFLAGYLVEIPLFTFLFWCFVYGINCFYSKVFLTRLIRVALH